MLFDATKRDVTVKSYYVSVYNISFIQGCGNNVTGTTTTTQAAGTTTITAITDGESTDVIMSMPVPTCDMVPT